MKLVLCPRCELNYITADEKYCKVCLQEMSGVLQPEEPELCSVCNERPVVPGRDICQVCMNEMNGAAADGGEDEELQEAGSEEEMTEMDSVSQMDEIIPEVENPGYGAIDDPMSLESAREDEEKQNEEEDEEEDDNV